MHSLHLELYIVGQSRRSLAALESIRRLCDSELAGRCQLQVVDVLEHPELAERANVLATPTLIRRFPLPVRRIIGDLTETRTVLDSLDAHPAETADEEEST